MSAMFSLNVAAVACPAVVGGFEDNLQKLFAYLESAHASKTDVVILPLGVLGGLPIGGLAHMASFVEAEAQALATLVHATRQWHLVCALGVRIMHAGVLRNAVAVCANGRLWGLVPQTTPGPWPELEEGIQTHFPSHHMTTWTPPSQLNASSLTAVPMGPLLFRLGVWNLIFGINEVQTLIPTGQGMVFQGLCQAFPWHFDVGCPCPWYVDADCAWRAGAKQQAEPGFDFAFARANLCGGGGEWLFSGHAVLAQRGRCARTPLLKPSVIQGQLLGEPCAPPYPTAAWVELPFAPQEFTPSLNLKEAASFKPQGVCIENIRIEFESAWRKVEADMPHENVPPANVLQTNSADFSNEAETLELLWEALALGLGAYIEAAGCFQCVGLGLSGGRDSALGLLVAWRWAKTKGVSPKRVHAFSMPSLHSAPQTQKAAQTLAEELGVSFSVHSIEEACERECEVVERMLGHKATPVTLQNIQARIRAMRLWNWANSAQALFLQTGNHSEKAVGYTTLGGDFSGGFSPLADLPKTWVIRLLEHIQSRMNLEGLRQVLAQPASPELTTGQTTEAELLPFSLLDRLLEGLLGEGLVGEGLLGFAKEHFPEMSSEALGEEVRRIQKLVFSNQHKWHQAPPGLRLYSKSLRRFRWPLNGKLV